MKRRSQGKYFVNKAKTERYKQSSIPFMQRLLNKYDANVKNALKHIVSVPMNIAPEALSLRIFKIK